MTRHLSYGSTSRLVLAVLGWALLLMANLGAAQAAVLHGVLYDGTSWTVLDAPGAVSQTNPQGIDGNNIVGYYQDASGIHHGFLYDGTSWTIVDVPGASQTLILGIDGSELVGMYWDGVGNMHGFHYDGTSWTTLDVPGATLTAAHSIDGGNIVGTYFAGGAYHGFFYDGMSWTTLDWPDGPGTVAGGISGTNIAGELNSSGHGFLYDGATWTTLDVPGASRTIAYEIDGDNVVGSYFAGGTQHGFLYDGATYTTVDAPGASLTSLSAIDGSNLLGVVIGDVPQPEIDVAPLALDFGDVVLPESNTLIVTISNVGLADLRLDSVEFGAGSSLDITMAASPALPLFVAPGASEDVVITYTPSALDVVGAELEIRSNDADERLVSVQLSGAGVASEAPPAEQISQVLDFVDGSVESGALVGSGKGNSGAGRLSALSNQIEAVGDLVTLGMIDDACGQLRATLKRTDGVFPPPDFVEGDAREMLALLIEITRADLDCD